MKILFVADINNPIARNWIAFFLHQGDQIEIITQYPAVENVMPGVRIHSTPLWMSSAYNLSIGVRALRRQLGQESSAARNLLARILRNGIFKSGLQAFWRGHVCPLDVPRLMKKVQRLADSIRPDLVHGLRIPMEGQSLARLRGYPVVLSIWGYDLAFFATRYRGHRRLTRLALKRADGLHADAHKDIRLAQRLGYLDAKPTLVCPGSGGIRTREPVEEALIRKWRGQLGLAAATPVIINPRGIRDYIKTREYLLAIPHVLRRHPQAVFVSPGARDDFKTVSLVQKLGLGAAVRLLPSIPQADLFALMRLAQVMVSPSIYDGTPNTLLEAMAQGAFPVASDLESIREWITPGENGLLFDATNPAEIAQAILAALENQAFRERGREINFQLVRQRADYTACMRRAREFYQTVITRYQAAPAENLPEGDTQACLNATAFLKS